MPPQISVVERPPPYAEVARAEAAQVEAAREFFSPFPPCGGRAGDGGANVARPATKSNCDPSPTGPAALAALSFGFAALWLILLPWIARQPHVAARLQELDAQGIDPSAMFYSELPAMDDVQIRLGRIRRDDPQALWSFPPCVSPSTPTATPTN